MQWPTLSLWSDSDAVTDPHTLVELAGLSTKVATGTLPNRNLTGTDLDEVLKLASFDVRVIDEVGPDEIMVGRSTRDQRQIILAAAAKSETAASKLLNQASPSATLSVLDGAGHGARRDRLRQVALDRPDRSDYRWYTDDPAYVTLLERCIAHGGMTGNLLATYALALDGEGLAQLGTRFAQAPAASVELADVDTLLTCTHGRPDIVRTWVEQGSDLAKAVAAADHRQDDRFIATLTVTDRDFAGLFADAASRNVCVDVRYAVEGLRRQVCAILDDHDNDEIEERLEGWYELATSVLERRNTAGAAIREALTTGLNDDVLTELITGDAEITTLLTAEVLKVHPAAGNYGLLYSGWDDLGWASMPGRLRCQIAMAAPDEALADSSWVDACRRLGLGPAAEPDTGDHRQMTARAATETEDRRNGHGYLCTAAPTLAPALTTTARWKAFYRAALHQNNRHATLGEILDRVTAIAEPSTTKYAAVLGNALGSLD